MMTPAPSPEIVVYTLPWCPHCSRAKALLSRRGLRFGEIDVSGWSGFRRRLGELTGGRTVPQIVIDGRPVGGADRLGALDRAGILAALGAGEQFPIARVRRRLTPRSLMRAVSARVRGRGRVSAVEELVVMLDLSGQVVSAREISDTEKGVADGEGMFRPAGRHRHA